MTTLRAHFDGQRVILDEPAPPHLNANTPVKVLVEDDKPNGALAAIAKLAAPADVPPDFAHQHEHYVKGLPKR